MISNNIYKIEITKHAYFRAYQRGITPDLIYSSIRCGKIIRFSKNHLKFVNKRKKNTIICVDEIRDSRIIIVTVEIK